MTVGGELLAGRYRLVNRIATGGMGSVWEAWDELLHRRVAIKELLTQPGLNPDDAATARNRVIREARITARLHHPHAVTLYDVLDHGGQPCLILQYVPSRTLNSILAEQGSLQVGFVSGVGAELASALAAAHDVGIVHRDVKPSNVLIDPAGAALITDFGISHAVGDLSLTSTGMVSGTPAFLAPEVARGAPSGFPADVFSLGATLYAALEGTPPFGTDQNPMAVLHKVASGQIVPPRRSGTLNTLLLHMLAKDPLTRPSMSTVARLLADAGNPGSSTMSGSDLRTVADVPQTVRAWPADRGEGARPGPASARGLAKAAAVPVHPRSRPRRWVVVAVTVVVLTAVAAWLLAGGTRQVPPTAGTSSVPVPAPSSATPSRSAASSPAVHPVATGALTSAPPTIRARRTASAAPAMPASTTAASATTASTNAASADVARTSVPRTSVAPTTAETAPTAAQLAAAITDYYAVLPADTDQGWGDLTSGFQHGAAQSRQYYQRFWDSVQRVTATDAHGASPDTAEATITYYFKDGRTAVEITVYSLVRHGGVLQIDSSQVLSSTIR